MDKIVFFDIDGTLLDHEKKLPASTKRSIKILQDNGVYVAIATGRAPFMFENLRKELNIDSFISFNGQYVVFENEIIYKNPLSKQYLRQLVDFSEQNNHSLVFMNDRTMKANVVHDSAIEKSLESLRFGHPEYDEFFYEHKDIYQVLLFCEQNEEEIYKIKYPHFHFIRWHEFSLDIIPNGGSKAEGIKKMIARLGFEMKDVYAFGDGLNDIEMLETVGNGVAMGNGHELAKKAATYETSSVEEDGIFEGLKKLGLISS